jgi:coatomer protein complex subunit gamma
VDVFFGVTKLFQSPDGNLRRMVYLFLRSVVEHTDASSLIIVTQSLVKDMFTDVALFKGNALRVLGSIVDPSMLGQLDRYFKQMLVDKDDYVASSACTTALLLMNKPAALDTISRWVNEVQTVLQSRSDMVQFHALALLRSIKRHDRLAVSKVVHTLMKGSMRSPLGICLLIRYTQSLLASDPSSVDQHVCFNHLYG